MMCCAVLQVPGKEEFHETIRYFSGELAATGVHTRLGARVDAAALLGGGFDQACTRSSVRTSVHTCVHAIPVLPQVVLATGVAPRALQIEGADHPKVASYYDVLTRRAPVGESVAIVGAGGIGFDVAEFLSSDDPEAPPEIDAFLRSWGVDKTLSSRGGLTDPEPHESVRDITMCQRSEGKLGANLGKTTGWIHRAELKKKGIVGLSGVTYDKIDDQGLHIQRGGGPELLEVDTVVVCAGQVSARELEQPLKDAGVEVHLIGGAELAAELDAKRAIDQGLRLAARL